MCKLITISISTRSLSSLFYLKNQEIIGQHVFQIARILLAHIYNIAKHDYLPIVSKDNIFNLSDETVPHSNACLSLPTTNRFMNSCYIQLSTTNPSY